jgi:phenylalanyl-tRNA synthetase alpha chain
MNKEVDSIIQTLSPNERAILQFLHLNDIPKIAEHSKLDETGVKRALEYLSNKKIVEISISSIKQVSLGDNGVLYLKNELPERRLLNALASEKDKKASLKEAKEKSKLSDNEFSIALGALKGKALITMSDDMITLTAKDSEIGKKFPEEKFLEILPLEYEKLTDEQKYSLENLKKRKDIVKIDEIKSIGFSITALGKEILKHSEQIKEASHLLENLTPEILRNQAWKGKQFRHYDIESNVPAIYGGKRHFVNQAIDYARRIWTDMGFREMKGPVINTSFWDFDALFVPQDHPAREMQDTFFLSEKGSLPDRALIAKIKKAHEKGTAGSKGWQYAWSEEEAKKLVLRTHTTVLSARTLAQLKKADWPAKFFAIGRNYRNEALDQTHLFEFNQTEGIVVDPNANFRHLLGYLKEFFAKMGFPKARFRPSYFPYTEPSMEIDVYHPVLKKWLELGGAGILRPEVVEPLLGEAIPVLAWGPGFDRILLDYYKITDIRDLYKNDLKQLRTIKFWNYKGGKW